MKKSTKIVLLAVLLAIVGGIVYTVLTWPIYPQPRKNVDSYQQLRQDMEKTGVLVPPENVLPWVETFYSQELDGRDRLSKPRAFLMSGTVEYGGASYRAEIFSEMDLRVARGDLAAGKLSDDAHLPGRVGRFGAVFLEH